MKTKILIVDDDADTREMYVEIFEQAGYHVIEAVDGLEGLDKATRVFPDIIFTGIVMPRMDGFTLVEALKKNARTARIPVVINSHLAREEDQRKAYDLGVDDFIVRDTTPPREVLDRIKAIHSGGEYFLEFDAHTPEAQRLVVDTGLGNFFSCHEQHQMKLHLKIKDLANKVFEARFVCPEEEVKKR